MTHEPTTPHAPSNEAGNDATAEHPFGQQYWEDRYGAPVMPEVATPTRCSSQKHHRCPWAARSTPAAAKARLGWGSRIP